MILRRHLLLAALPASLVPCVRAEDAPGFRRAAFDAKSLPQALKALGLPGAQASKDVLLQAPELFEDGTVVPITIGCTLPGVQRLLVGVDHNPTWLAATFDPTDAIEPRLSLRLKMQETSPVTVLAVMADGRVLSASKEVKITLGGCGGAADPVPAQAAASPTLIRVQAAGAGATVRALMKHEMESGQRKDDAGKPVPAWHIQEVTARVNGQPVLSAQWGTAVSKNPFLQFGLRSARPGDKVALAWVDNRGAQRSDEVAFAAA
jgi:thiosulfate oxidation carrier complex protein SoxZ